MLRHAPHLVAIVLLAACAGLDPEAFRAGRGQSREPDVAGFSFDAGPSPDAGGRAGSAARPASSSGRSDAGRSASSEGGEAGESNDGGAAGAETNTGNAGAGGIGASGGRPTNGGGRPAGGSGGRGGFFGRAGGDGSAGRASGGSGQGATPATHALYFSEYVEGSSSYKALEITAREASTFVGCRLVTYFNGSSAGSGIALDGVLPSGESYVLCSTALATLLGAVCERATNLAFNGDDALALECDGVILDVIGQIGVDPGDGWGSGDASTLNHTLGRNCAASAGDRDGSDPFDPASEWTPLGVDAFEGLGRRECAG